VQLHAYVLIDNHVHLLATPAAAEDIGRLMQRLGRHYVGLFNARHRRTGTLWEGRYKSCLVDSERYVLTCQRYIGLNPVRAESPTMRSPGAGPVAPPIWANAKDRC
jgi:putative transposase